MNDKETIKNQYLVRILKENGELYEFYMYSPTDETAIENANAGFQRNFEMTGLVDNLGIKIMEEKINE